MRTKPLIFALLLITTVANAQLITGLTIESATIGLNGEMGPEKAINGFGLDGDVPSLTASHRSGFNTNWWTGWDGAVTEWQITIDLEGNYDLDVVHIWNYREGATLNGRGLSNVEIFVSPDEDEANLVKLTTDGTGIHDAGGNFLLPVAPNDAQYLGFDLDLSGVTNAALLDNVRLFRIDGGSINHNRGADWGGLAEIQFSGIPAVDGSGILLNIAPNGANFDFSWNSKEGKVYDLVSATDLSTTPDTWPVYDPDGPGGIDPYGDLSSGGDMTSLAAVPSGDATRYFAVVEKDPPPLFSWDFETDDGGFTTTGTPNDWAWGTPNSNNDAGLTLTTGNGDSTGCWATNLGDGSGPPAGVIVPAVDSILRSPDLDLTAVTGAQLSFATAVDARTGDTIEILIREVGTDLQLGSTIIPITAPATEDWAGFGPFDLSAADGKSVYLEFRYVGTDALFIGWYIDDIMITAP